MEIIEGKRKGKRYIVYTESEAREAGIEYKRWDSDPEKGDWILTDDGYVIQVLGKSIISRGYDKGGRIYRTIKKSYTHKTKKFTVGDVEGARYIIGRDKKVAARRHSRYFRRKKEKFFAELYIAFLGMPDWWYKAYIAAFPEEEGIDKKECNTKLKALLKRKVVRETIMEQLKDTLEKVGMTKEWYFKQLKKLIEKGDEKTQLEGLKFAAPFLGVGSQKISLKETKTIELTQGQLKALKEMKRSALKGSSVEEVDYEEVDNANKD